MTTEFGRSIPEAEGLNQLATDQLLQEAARFRERIINHSFEALKLYLRTDAVMLQEVEDKKFEPGTEVSYFVLEDYLGAPFVDDQPQSTWSLLLVGNRSLGDKRSDFLSIHIPIVDSESAVEDMTPPTAIYVERFNNGLHSSHKITKDALEAYVNAAHEGEQLLESDVSEELSVQEIHLRVNTGLSFLTKLNEDMINMVVTPQRTFKVGDPT